MRLYNDMDCIGGQLMKMDTEYWFNISMILFLIIIIGLMIRDYGEYLK
jgi:hypothetical protein